MIVIGFAACKKDMNQGDLASKDASGANMNSVGLQVRNGMIAFANWEEFNQTMNNLKNKEISEVEGMIKSLPGFRSLLAKQESGINERQGRTTDPDDEPFLATDNPEGDNDFVQDPFLLAVLNEKASIMIADFIYRVTPKGVFAHRINEESVMDEFIAKPDLDATISPFSVVETDSDQVLPEVSPGVFLVYKGDDLTAECVDCQQQSSSRDLFNTCTGLGSNLFGVIKDCDIDYASKRRARGTVWSQNLGFYASIGVKTRNQRRRFWIWWNVNADMVALKAKGKFESKALGPLPVIIPYDIPYSQNFNDNKIVRRLDFNTAIIGTVCEGNGKCKPKIKFAKRYKIKEHQSDHEVHAMGIRNFIKILK